MTDLVGVVTKEILADREKWLESRTNTIGGSDAACVIGKSPFKSNVELWNEKKGLSSSEDISQKPAVLYGTNAERYLRELFALDFPEYEVMYEENNIWHNANFPWAHVSLDGWLRDENGELGILEIKTTTITSKMQKDKWKDAIPEHYYLQVLHEMAVTEAQFCWLKAQLKTERIGSDGEKDLYCETKHYVIRRTDEGVEDDIKELMNAEKTFYESLADGVQPAKILPTI